MLSPCGWPFPLQGPPGLRLPRRTPWPYRRGAAGGPGGCAQRRWRRCDQSLSGRGWVGGWVGGEGGGEGNEGTQFARGVPGCMPAARLEIQVCCQSAQQVAGLAGIGASIASSPGAGTLHTTALLLGCWLTECMRDCHPGRAHTHLPHAPARSWPGSSARRRRPRRRLTREGWCGAGGGVELGERRVGTTRLQAADAVVWCGRRVRSPRGSAGSACGAQQLGARSGDPPQ